MKKINLKILLLLFFYVSVFSCHAQILPLKTSLLNIPNNAHVKDLDNVLNPFVGTYKANFQGNEITLYITKVEDKLEVRSTKQFYRDALVVKYIVKNGGLILQDTKNFISDIELYSFYYSSSKNHAILYYSGTNCRVGWGDIFLKKINPTQISWEYKPDDIILDDITCPPGTNITIYLPETKDLIFTKQ